VIQVALHDPALVKSAIEDPSVNELLAFTICLPQPPSSGYPSCLSEPERFPNPNAGEVVDVDEIEHAGFVSEAWRVVKKRSREDRTDALAPLRYRDEEARVADLQKTVSVSGAYSIIIGRLIE